MCVKGVKEENKNKRSDKIRFKFKNSILAAV